MILDSGPDWYKNEAFWIKYKPLMFDPDRMEDTAKEVDFLLGITGARPGSAVLDLCCGEGRHDLVLARRGFSVTGVDLTAAYLDKGRRDAAAAGLEIEFAAADIREFCRPDRYDLAFNWFTSFGYFEDPDDDERVVRNAYASLHPGGKLVIETLGKESVCLNFKEREWFQRDGYLIMLEYRLVDACTRLENRWLFHPDDPAAPGELTETRFSVKLYSAEEMGMLLGRNGFGRMRFYGDIEGNPYNHKAKTMIVVAEKG
jgi:SAM-dependent methyltransferase